MMDADERKAAFALARATAYEVSLARHSVVPEPAPTPQPHALTDAEMLRLETLIDNKIVAAFEARQWEHDATVEAVGRALGETRKKMRAEIQEQIAKAHRPDAGQEFFDLDDGVKQDTDLHRPILNAIDNPIEQNIMKPIRERNRARWLAQQKASRRG
jgi:DNA-binding GntR family transcriptional regulator